MDFTYVLEKIERAELTESPFRHLEVDDLFNAEDFAKIIGSAEISLDLAVSDDELFSRLFDRGYKIIDFPGCTSDQAEYVRWHRSKSRSHKTNTACEGFGVVLRLYQADSDVIAQLQEFLNSRALIECLAGKFGIDPAECSYDAGIQKYLDGYEISPHPDIRRKALTYMVNINPSPDSEAEDYHTSYLSLLPQWDYVERFWQGNNEYDRAWVPWDWCRIEKQQRKNNSMVIFQPGEDTLHGVKAAYDHLRFQRTQLYGNLWYKDRPGLKVVNWEDLLIRPRGKPASGNSPIRSLTKRIASPFKKIFRGTAASRNQSKLGNRTID